MKKMIIILAIILVIIAIGIGGYYHYNKNMVKTSFQESNLVLQALQQGNERFVSGNPLQHDYEKQILDTKKTQSPKAVVFGCMDSRSIPELVFDQGIGDIFTIRIAGNAINPDILGSMEFATKVVGAKLIVVLGHTNCSAVRSACLGDRLGNLTGLLQQIQPAVQMTETAMKKKDCDDAGLVDAIAKQNVMNMVKQIPQQSPIIAELIKEKKVRVIGAMYDVATGRVTFLSDASGIYIAENTNSNTSIKS